MTAPDKYLAPFVRIPASAVYGLASYLGCNTTQARDAVGILALLQEAGGTMQHSHGWIAAEIASTKRTVRRVTDLMTAAGLISEETENGKTPRFTLSIDLHGDEWAAISAVGLQKQNSVKSGKGGQSGNTNASKNDSAHRAESNPDPTVASYGKASKNDL